MAKKDIILSGEQNDFIMYHSNDGKVNVALMTCDGNVWLNQQQIATLFATSKQNVGQHIANVLREGELDVHSVVKNYLTTASKCSLPKRRINCFMPLPIIRLLKLS